MRTLEVRYVNHFSNNNVKSYQICIPLFLNLNVLASDHNNVLNLIHEPFLKLPRLEDYIPNWPKNRRFISMLEYYGYVFDIKILDLENVLAPHSLIWLVFWYALKVLPSKNKRI